MALGFLQMVPSVAQLREKWILLFLHRFYKICAHPLYAKQVRLLISSIYHTSSAHLPAVRCVLYSTTVRQHDAVGQLLDMCTAL